MNRKILAAGLLAIAFFAVISCGEESDLNLQCPPQDPEDTQSIRILVATALAYPSMAGMIPGPLEETGFLPTDSEINLFSILDTARVLCIPPLDYLQQFNAILIFTDAWPAETDWARYDTIGDLLADYVDTGGGLVMCQYAMYDGAARIRGRICSPGYAPLKPGPLERLSIDDRTVTIDSIDFPLHPIFYGIDIGKLIMPGDFLAYPGVDETAILLARDNLETNAIAINTDGNIIALNMYTKAFAFPDYPEAIKLVANSLLYVAD